MAKRGPARGPLVLLTDFGPGSPYVGQVKLVLARLAPRTPVLDLAHDLPPQNLPAAWLVLRAAERFLPRRAVLCAVVDPGVGSARRLLAAEYAGGLRAVLPDNGLLPALSRRGPPVALHVLTAARYWLPEVSPVFQGRDILAPVAARLACGLPLELLGPRVAWSELAPPAWPALRLSGRAVEAQVLYADRFGNLVTNLRMEDVRAVRQVLCRRRRIPFVRHYAAVEPGTLLALWDSFGCLELAVREGSAAARLHAGPGTAVHVETEG